MKTLTLDLGTHVGWTQMDGSRIVKSGTQHLATKEELRIQRREGKERTLDLRFARMLAFLHEQFAPGIDRVVVEDVTFSGSPMQNQLWSALRAAIWVVAPTVQATICCVPVTTLKVFATGKTRADKSQMAQALADADPKLYELKQGLVWLREDGRIADDNEVDAIWLGRFTAMVDRGEQSFLNAYQRKMTKHAERQTRRRVAKAARKARKARQLAEVAARKALLKAAVRAAGRCCGVLRQLKPGNRAICPICHASVKIRISPVAEPEISGLTIIADSTLPNTAVL